jgi:hypothetical protein
VEIRSAGPPTAPEAQPVRQELEESGEGFRGTIVPGSTASAKFAFDIPKGAKGALDIEVQPDSTLEYASWHWVGKTP